MELSDGALSSLLRSIKLMRVNNFAFKQLQIISFLLSVAIISNSCPDYLNHLLLYEKIKEKKTKNTKTKAIKTI